MLEIEIKEEPIDILPDYAKTAIAFEVQSILEVELPENDLHGIKLIERRVEKPWIKDYDAYQAEGPLSWAQRWNISNWVVISAFVKGARVGGCVIAYDTPGVLKLEERKDIAALWDLRVLPRFRGKGIGGRLVDTAVAWAKRKQCRLMKIETQNINVPACRLYVKHGFTLGAINRYAYPELPDEIELIWCREL